MPKPQKLKSKRDSPFAKSKEKIADSNSELVKFSFKYLIGDNPKFVFINLDSDYFLKLIDRLKDISKMSINDFRQSRSTSLRAHSIDWDATTESCFGLPGEEQIVEIPYQFCVSANEYGRVHGFLIQNRFYIVWLDREHKLYP